MRLKRFWALLVCVSLALATVLAGCATASTAPTAAPVATTAAATEAATPAPTAKGEPIKLVLEKPIWGDKPADAPFVKQLEQKILEKLNIDLTVTGEQNPSDQEEKAKLMLSSGEQLDMFNMGDWTKYMTTGTIIPLNDLLNKYGQDILNKSIPEAIKNHTDKDGKIWATGYEQYPVSIVVWMRQDWLDALKLQVPTTIDEYENAVLQMKQKYNDQGFVPLWPNILEAAFAGSFVKTSDQDFVDTDGKIKPYFMAPGYTDFLAKMADWYKKGILHKEIATMTSQQARDTFNAGQSGEIMNWIQNVSLDESLLQAKVPDGKLAGVPPLKGTYPGCYTSSVPWGWGTCITASCKNPEAAMQYINYTLATDEGYLLTTYGVEGTQWEWADQSKGIIKELLKPTDDLYVGTGGENHLTCGVLKSIFSKYSTSQRDMDFMNWLNDPTKVSTSTAVDMNVAYDNSKMDGQENFAALDTLINEAKWKIIMGDQPVSTWDSVVKDWLSKGGDKWIDGHTAQYNTSIGK